MSNESQTPQAETSPEGSSAVERRVMPTEDDAERISRLGPLELWGRRRPEPNEFTELADAVRELRAALLKPLLPLVGWLARKLGGK